jgi:hypothetical protein
MSINSLRKDATRGLVAAAYFVAGGEVNDKTRMTKPETSIKPE